MSKFRPIASISEIIIHCADTPNGRPGTAADIDQWHADRKFKRHPDALIGAGKWAGKGLHAPALKHIGYHFVIRIDGVVEVGRRLTETGAHAKGHNNQSIGICMFGRDAFTAEQWASLRVMVRGLHRDLKRQGVATLVDLGHRDVAGYKTCPGFDVAAWEKTGMNAPADGLVVIHHD